ncbi:MAG: lipoyl(octanoyl) transferase [Flavobacteriia bacterium]|nr:MAG: lipoyl(octanoyl) transferase [Flavobacteriia bacterium]
MQDIILEDIGLKRYGEALAYQLQHFEATKQLKIANRTSENPQPTTNYFFFVTHPHVYTMGKNGNLANVLIGEKDLEDKHIEFFHTNRGGDITYHGPGQIVGYPILDLDLFKADIHQYMRALEEVIINVLKRYGLEGERSEGETGVWLDQGKSTARKICAMGVHTSRWVTMHGFALNVNTDLQFFNYIIPCGIRNKGVTSIAKELGKTIDETVVKQQILDEFSKVFNARFIER